MRYTEYHAGVAVIADKDKLPEAMKRLAEYEDLEDIKNKELKEAYELLRENCAAHPHTCIGCTFAKNGWGKALTCIFEISGTFPTEWEDVE